MSRACRAVAGWGAQALTDSENRKAQTGLQQKRARHLKTNKFLYKKTIMLKAVFVLQKII